MYVRYVVTFMKAKKLRHSARSARLRPQKFKELVDTELTFVTEHVIGIAKDVDPEIKKGLQANFEGECTEVGMYLAMSRQADREGYPEIAEAFKRYALKRPTMLLVSANCWATWFGTRRRT